MLNWEKIDNEKVFQRLVNHLFALECNSPGFIPSSPYIGADGGWDGFYNGYYAQESQAGIWSIQSKWTKKSFSEARSWLKTEIKKELRSARKNMVQHLRIATNAELKVDQVRDLENLNSGEVASLRILHREELSRRMELQPFLVRVFFGLPQYPKFVPGEIYFAQTEKHLITVPAIRITKFKDYLDRIGQFVRSDATNILSINSPGGYGKSHLLRDIQEIAYKADPERQTWMTGQGYPKMEQAIQDEIVAGRKYLLMFDDADRYLEEIKPLLSFARFQGNSVKIILALRTSGVQIISDIIRELRCEETYDAMSIRTWTREELIHLLRMVTEQEKVEDEDAWAALYPNPYLIVWIAKQMKKEPTIDFKKIKEKFNDDVDFEAKRCLKDILTDSAIREFIVNLACIAPFSEKDLRAVGILSEKFGVKVELIRGKLSMLRQAGVLRQVGNSLRFDPDMKGDLYLAYSVAKSDIKTLRDLVLRWLPRYAEKLFVNLEGAARYGEVPAVEKVFSEIIDSWTSEAASTPGIERQERLKLMAQIANIVPRNSVNLLYSYLHSDPPPSEEPFLKALGVHYTQLTTDDYGPGIMPLLRIPEVRTDVIGIIQEINGKGIEMIYDNYKPLSLIKSSLSPLTNTPAIILSTLDIFGKWLEQPTDSKIKLICAGVSEVLAGTHSFTKSTMSGIVFGENMLKPTKEIIEIREKALGILKSMVRDKSLEVKLAGIKTAEKIGESRGGIGPRSRMPLADRIAKEREEIIEGIGKLISKDADFPLLSEIEDLFVKWWAMEMPGADKAKYYLQKFPRDTEYIVYRYFVAPEYVVKDFALMERESPKEDRWGWFVHNVMNSRRHRNREYFEQEAKILDEKYDTEEKAASYLAGLYEKVSIQPEQWPRPLIISCWVSLNPKLFVSIRGDSDLWRKIPERFRNEIDSAIGTMDKEFVKKLAEEVLEELPQTPPLKVDTFLTMLGREAVEEKRIESWLLAIVEKGTSEHRILVISHLDSIFERNSNINLALRVSLALVSKDKELSYRTIDNLAFFVHRLRKDMEKADKELLEKFEKELLEKIKDLPKLEWHSQELLEFVFHGIDSAIEFVEYRLKKSKEIREKDKKDGNFDAVPFGGLWCIKSQISSFGDYEKFMDKVMEWRKEDDPYAEFYLKYLMESIEGLENKDSGKLFIEEYAEKQIGNNNIINAIQTAECMTLRDNTISILLKVGEAGIAEGSSKEIEGLFYGKAYPESGFSGKVGKVPQELEARKPILQKLLEMTKPGELRVIIEKSIGIVNALIKDKLERDEEFLSPRG